MPPKDRISGGEEADANTIPWQAHLNVTYENDGDWKGDCGAVILGPRHVITAAHCTGTWVKDKNGFWVWGRSLVKAELKVRLHCNYKIRYDRLS